MIAIDVVCVFISCLKCFAFSALDEILHDPDTPLPWDRRVSLLIDVAHGMNYLHTLVPRVIHRDLK